MTPSVVRVSVPWLLPVAGAKVERAPLPWMSAIGVMVTVAVTCQTKLRDAVAWVPEALSSTVTWALQSHVAVGVPVMAPVPASMEMPVGSPVALHEYGAVPPVAD